MALVHQSPIVCALSVTDLDRSIAWYKEVLGLKEHLMAPEMGWAELTTAVDGFTIGLGVRETVAKEGGGTVTLGVSDIEKERAGLEAAGVTFDGPTMEIPGQVKLATFFDPDGNQLMLAQNLA